MANSPSQSVSDAPYPTSSDPDSFSASGAAASAQGMVNRAVQGAHAAVDTVARKVESAVDRFKTGASSTAESVQQGAGEIAEMEKAMMESVRSTVRDHPLITVGLAVVAGMLLSRIMSSSSR